MVEIVNDSSRGDLAFTNVGSTLEAVLVQNTNQDTTVTLVDPAAVNTLDLGLSAVTKDALVVPVVSLDGVETINVFSMNAANTVQLDADAVETITVDGDADLTLTMSAATVNVSLLDASQASGDVTATFVNQTGVRHRSLFPPWVVPVTTGWMSRP